MKKTTKLCAGRRALRFWTTVAGLAAPIALAAMAQAQTFDSKSGDADDGDFNLTGRSGTVNFNPKDFLINGGPVHIDANGDLVFHFAKIIIPSGVTLKMSAEWTNGPIYWLASEDVTIAGTIDLSGGNGHVRTASANQRVPPLPGSDRFPGPGGFLGGLGGNTVLGPAQPGAGPGGGAGITTSQPTGWWLGFGAKRTANEFLVPLVGGSGGGGGVDQNVQWWASGGGAGGGALLIASSKTINLTGIIRSRGGHGGYISTRPGFSDCNHYGGGGGGGGSIRLVATTLSGGGTIDTYGSVVNGGYCSNPGVGPVFGADGRVRLEAYQYAATYGVPYGVSTRGTPFSTYVPAVPQVQPSLWIAEVDGQSVPPDPTGGFGTVNNVNEYVTINAAATEPVIVKINGRNLPAPSAKTLTPMLHVFALEGNDLSKPCDAAMAESPDDPSLLTCDVTIADTPAGPGFPPGFSRAYARVNWN